MAKGQLIDEHVSAQQCKLAVDALLDHAQKVEEKRSENELLPGKEQNVWLVVTTKQMHPEKKLKPAKIPIAHPLVDPRTSSVCLITKDPQREYKDLLESHGIRFINRVVGITKLKGKFKPFEARRMLLKENGLFLADERVVPLLPKLLGKKFFEAKKQPIPVCLTRKDLKGELERAISSTYFHQNQGTCTSVKVGTLSQKPSQVLDNLKTALPAVVKHIKGGWDNVQSFHIKTNSSASLPIWSCDLGEEDGARWANFNLEEGSDSESAGSAEKKEDASDKEDIPAPSVAKGKKKAADSTAATGKPAKNAPEKPKKKTKSAVEGKDHDTQATAPAPKPAAAKKANESQPAASTPKAPPAATAEEPRKKALSAADKKKEKVVKSKAGEKTAKTAIVGKKKAAVL
ncbi:ribosomal protein L1 [Obba rivulosa]|uniref:Ribosomal L1 domain-containing protein 1 n=1 Tax=Obba rivulosa TaxID=1052685 RepID=A0A8E2DNM5_9APHY|nr:ribosomal protein L1 [Obba rivulosa]